MYSFESISVPFNLSTHECHKWLLFIYYLFLLLLTLKDSLASSFLLLTVVIIFFWSINYATFNELLVCYINKHQLLLPCVLY